MRLNIPALDRSAAALALRFGVRGARLIVYSAAYGLTFLIWYAAFRLADSL